MGAIFPGCEEQAECTCRCGTWARRWFAFRRRPAALPLLCCAHHAAHAPGCSRPVGLPCRWLQARLLRSERGLGGVLAKAEIRWVDRQAVGRLASMQRACTLHLLALRWHAGGILAGHDYLTAAEVAAKPDNTQDWSGTTALQPENKVTPAPPCCSACCGVARAVMRSPPQQPICPAAAVCMDGSKQEGAVKGAVNEFAQAHGLSILVTYKCGFAKYNWCAWLRLWCWHWRVNSLCLLVCAGWLWCKLCCAHGKSARVMCSLLPAGCPTPAPLALPQ